MNRDPSNLLAELVSADQRIKELEAENQRLREAAGWQWFSIDDRLPADGEWCWVDGDRFNGPFPAVWSERSGRWTNEDTWEDFVGDVRRWCPIPEPPASGEVGEVSYLVFAGDAYYPDGGWEDFRGHAGSVDIAKSFIESLATERARSGRDPFEWAQIVDVHAKAIVLNGRSLVLGSLKKRLCDVDAGVKWYTWKPLVGEDVFDGNG